MAAIAVAALVSCRAERERRDETVVVFAAASLTDAFTDLERDFESAHPGVDVVVSFAGSQTLAVQIEAGAPADVFASANLAHASRLEAADLVDEPRQLASASLVAIAPSANPLGLSSPADFVRATRIVVGDARVPIGEYTDQLLDKAAAAGAVDAAWAAHVRGHVVSREQSVRAIRTKVALGEADLGFVYRPDAVDSDDVVTIPLPRSLAPRAEYAIALTTPGQARPVARSFVDYVLSATGEVTLAAHGFEPPGLP